MSAFDALVPWPALPGIQDVLNGSTLNRALDQLQVRFAALMRSLEGREGERAKNYICPYVKSQDHP
jgi:hypothetical protein